MFAAVACCDRAEQVEAQNEAAGKQKGGSARGYISTTVQSNYKQ